MSTLETTAVAVFAALVLAFLAFAVPWNGTGRCENQNGRIIHWQGAQCPAGYHPR